jgi:site-specific recombinase XerD
MTAHPTLAATWQQPDATQYAALSFLARYRGGTLRVYTQDLKAFLGWCAERAIEPLQAQRPHLELYLRWMEQRNLDPPPSAGASRPSRASTATP